MAILGLLCNLVVTVVSSIQFALKGLIEWKKLGWLIALSLPFSYFTGGLKISSEFFFLSLALALILAAMAMLIKLKPRKEESEQGKWIYFVVPFIGLLSGLTGIGGGIYLAPLLYLAHWSDARRIAAVTSIFIALNSVSGLLARSNHFDSVLNLNNEWLLLPLAVLMGGAIGSRWSSSLLHPKWIKNITAGILIFASIRLFIQWL